MQGICYVLICYQLLEIYVIQLPISIRIASLADFQRTSEATLKNMGEIDYSEPQQNIEKGGLCPSFLG